MGTYSTYQTDKKREEEGTWAEMPDGSEWKLARASSKRSQQARKKAEQPHRSLLQRCERMGTPIPEEIEDEINMEWMANGVVLDWKGVTGPSGDELEFTDANVRQVLTDLPDLTLDVVRASGNIANYRQQEIEEEGKS